MIDHHLKPDSPAASRTHSPVTVGRGSRAQVVRAKTARATVSPINRSIDVEEDLMEEEEDEEEDEEISSG